MRAAHGILFVLMIVAGGSALPSTLRAQSLEESEPACPDPDMEKGDLCGFAHAAIARMEAQKTAAATLPQALLDAQDDTDITHCFLDLEVKLNPNTLSGSNTLDVTSRTNGLNQFTLDLYNNMTVSSVLVNGSNATFSRPGNQIVINLGDVYDADETFQVKVTYSGVPSSSGSMDSAAFTFRTHMTNGVPVSIVSSLSQGFYAHRWWPCKENYTSLEDKFTTDIWVTAPDWMIVASNGALQGIDNLSMSRKRTRWKSIYPNSTYGVSVAMTNYAKTVMNYNYAGGSMPVELYLYPETEGSSLSQLSNLLEMVTVLSDPGVFGQYPFIQEKYGIAQFNTPFGLEHQTITSQGNFVERRNVHELAHSWWGNSITCKTWNHVWVNEGWATYGESLYYERRPGGSHADYLNHMNARRPSTGNFGGIVYRSDTDIMTTNGIFNQPVVYFKGQWVLHMLRHVIGEAAFFQSLADYRAQFEGGTAGIDDYQAIVETVSGQDLDWFFNEWIYAGGAPYYRYGWQAAQIDGQNYVRLYVQQYQDTLGHPFMTMPIDVHVTTTAGTQTHVVWNDALAEQWFLIPVNGTPSSVLLDPDTWILRGAATPVAYPPGPPKLLTATPAPGAVLLSGAPPIQLRFSQPITFQAQDFVLSGADKGEVSVTVDYDPVASVVTLIPGAPLTYDTWTIAVDEQVNSAGVLLDGEIDAPPVLPSGNGLPGGDAVYTFTIALLPDFDHDLDVDALDTAHMLSCISMSQAPVAPDCSDTDLDGDSDADQVDFGLFQRCLNGPNAEPALGCIGL